MIELTPTVFVVDDDPAIRESLEFMFTGTGLRVETHASAEAFLAVVQPRRHGCLILDLRMPRMDGYELHRRLNALGPHLPVIMLTGHGDISAAVDEMKLGAFDFLSKPVNREVLLRRVREAIDVDSVRCRQEDETADIARRLATLSARELEVMDRVGLGHANKEIALELGLSERTVCNHRAHVIDKMGAVNTADLVRKMGLIGHINSRPA